MLLMGKDPEMKAKIQLPFTTWQKNVIEHALSELALKWQKQHEKDNPRDAEIPASVRQVRDLEFAINVHCKPRKQNLATDRLNAEGAQ